jgi:hypothetical protein
VNQEICSLPIGDAWGIGAPTWWPLLRGKGVATIRGLSSANCQATI